MRSPSGRRAADPGLVAAWAVESTFETYDSPAPYPGIRLRFSDWGFECADPFATAQGLCETTWAYALTLPVDLTPGVYDLTKIEGLTFETKFTLPHDGDCIGGEAGGDGGHEPSNSPGGEIEIFAITPDCIVGEVRYLPQHEAPELEHNGGFVAQTVPKRLCPPDGIPVLRVGTPYTAAG